jgi:spermidine synthase
MRGAPRAALYVVFLITGFTALTLQVVWQRVIALHSGVDLVSFTTVVAAFLAGLGIGNLVGGWLADRLGSRTALLAFSASNLVIGLFAMGSLWLLYDVYQDQAEAFTSAPSKFAFNFALVLVPTILMGLSLPLVARGVVGRVEEAGPLVGRLYAVNTLGAAAGAAVAGWYLLGTFGFVTTVRLAGALELLAAALVFVVWRVAASTAPPAPVPMRGEDPSAAPVEVGAHSGAVAPVAPDAGDARRIWPWFVIYALTGAVALGFELAFFRLVDSVVRSNSYTFPHVLGSYLLFFGIGSALGSVLVRRARRPDRWFLALQFLVGVAALTGLIVLVRVIPRSPFADNLSDYLGGIGFNLGFEDADGSLNSAFVPIFFGLPALVMGAPVALMGASFPFAQALVSRNLSTLGRHTGTLLFANVVGNVVGTLLVGFVALDRIGTAGTYTVLALALLAPGLGWAWLVGGRRRWVAGVAVLALMVSLVAVTPRNQRVWAFVNGVDQHELALAEDRSCASAITDVDGEQLLTINGSPQNGYPFDDFHVLVGLVPGVVHPDTRRAMALGLGIGATPYGLLANPDLEALSTVELCGGEIDLLEDLAAGGAPELQRLLGDPRQDLIVGDGRDFLLREDEAHDVVVVDVVRPQAGFSGNLYSVEFYRLVSDSLAPGGIMSQWAPTPRVLNTVLEVFPHVTLMVVPTYSSTPFVLASNEPVPFDRQVLLDRIGALRGAFSPEQHARLLEFATTVQPQCVRAGGEAPEVADDQLNHDLFPRDEYFLNNDDAAWPASSCA